MNKLFHIPKMKIVVISAAVVVLLAIVTLTVVCLNIETPGDHDDGADDVMAGVTLDESTDSNTVTTEAPVSETETERIPYDEEGLLYQNNGNGTCTIVGLGTCIKTDLEIPVESPDGLRVVAISTGAFENCSKIESIFIPSTVRDIGTGAFVGCRSLESFEVEGTNTEYCSVGSVLFSKDKTELVCYPAARIGSSYLLSTNVTRLAPYAFDSVSVLSKLLYRGTISQFQKIDIGTGNSVFTRMPIEFNYNAAK